MSQEVITMCCCRRDCVLLSIIAAAVLGVVGAFLQISGLITVTPAFLWVTLGIAVGYLAVLAGGFLLRKCGTPTSCLCRALSAVLVGLLGTQLLSVVLLAVGVTATSVVSAVLVGLLVAALALALGATACLVKCLADCESC